MRGTAGLLVVLGRIPGMLRRVVTGECRRPSEFTESCGRLPAAESAHRIDTVERFGDPDVVMELRPVRQHRVGVSARLPGVTGHHRTVDLWRSV